LESSQFHGIFDISADRPATDVVLLGAKSILGVRANLHPALQYLLLAAATEIHSESGIFQKAEQFPIAELGFSVRTWKRSLKTKMLTSRRTSPLATCPRPRHPTESRLTERTRFSCTAPAKPERIAQLRLHVPLRSVVAQLQAYLN
jgi:hypothetical protein